MNTNAIKFAVAVIALCLLQFFASVPWLAALGLDAGPWRGFRQLLGKLAKGILAALGVGVAAAFLLSYQQDPQFLTTLGRFYGVVLYTQLVLDFFVLVFSLLRLLWPRGGAVAMAAFRESIRQPMFWFFSVIAALIILVMPYIPYFTFGEDLKMVKELGYDVIMLSAAAFGVLAASLSISEEIEGRTAITLMSKPVSRRQFLLGKFAGILLASLLMTGLLSVVYLLVIWYKPIYDHEEVTAPMVLFRFGEWEGTISSAAVSLIGGVAWWMTDVVAAAPGLILGFCQGMVLLAIAVALATRVPMVVNLVTCLVVFFLGHLTPVLAQVSQNQVLVHFMAKLFDVLLPGLDVFNIGPALTKDTGLPTVDFAVYVGSVAGYALLYTAIALLLGLILFEDRDLA